MKSYVFGLCLLSGLFGAPAFAQEAPIEPIPNIYISEINWAGSSLSTADEWIELFNASGQSVDLGGWVLTGAATSGNALGITEGFVAAPGSSVLIANYGLGNEKTTLAVEPNLVTTALSLSNSNLSIMLTMPDGTVVDQVSELVGSTNPSTSMYRLSDGTWAASTSSANLLDANQLGTPGMYGDVVSSEPTEEISPPAMEGSGEVVSESEPEPAIEITEPEPTLEAPEPTVVEPTEPVVEEPVVAEEPIIEELIIEPAPEPTVEPTTEVTEPTEVNAPTETPALEEIPVIEQEIVETVSEAVVESEPVDESVEEPEIIESPAIIETPELITTLETTETVSLPILINEIVSNPVDGTEWIEFYNPNNTAVDLQNYSVNDATGKATTLSGEIASLGYFVVENPKGKLNNDSDDVVLSDQHGTVIDQMSYGNETNPAPDAGESLARSESSFIVTATITKGSANILPEPEVVSEYENDLTINPIETPSGEEDESTTVQDSQETNEGHTASVSDASTVHQVVAIATPASVKATKATTKASTKSSSSKSSKSTETVTGMVTALPGTFGTQIAFIDGIELYFYDANWPTLAIGDIVSVRGTRSTSHGESRIKIASANDITILRHEEPVPVSITASSLSEQNEGALVSVTGRIVEQDDDRIVLEDASGELTIVAHKNTGINWFDYSGAEVTIVGIVRSFDDGVMLYPRSTEDITIVENVMSNADDTSVAPVASSKSIYPWIGGGLAIVAFGALAYWYLANRGFMIRVPQLHNSAT